jgi:hypothetical protein
VVANHSGRHTPVLVPLCVPHFTMRFFGVMFSPAGPISGHVGPLTSAPAGRWATRGEA